MRHTKSAARISRIAGQVAIELESHPEFKPLCLDWLQGREWKRLSQSLAQDPLRKSLGKFSKGKLLWDFTLGLGSDALVFARLGLRVRAWERSPLIFALWQDAFQRAWKNPKWREILSDLEGVEGDALQLSVKNRSERPDYIYLDPMYPEVKQQVRRRKEIFFLREIVGDDHDASELFTKAQEFSPERIIVKRPARAEALGEKVAVSYPGKSHRLDVYIRGISYSSAALANDE